MKYLIGIIIAIAVLGGGYYFVTQTSVVPEGVEQAQVSDSETGTEGAASSSASVAGTSTATAAARVAIANTSLVAENLKFTFTGYGPGGKQHEGTFKTITTTDVKTGANGLPISGKVVLKADTVTTGIGGLDKDLCSDNFFNCSKYPEITFEYKSIREDAASGSFIVTGALSFNGNTKDVSFPVKQTSLLSFSSDFLLDTTPFKFKYVGVNKDVRIQFSFDLSANR